MNPLAASQASPGDFPPHARLGALLMLFGLCGPLVAAEAQLTYADLVSRLTDLERLPVLPTSGDQCALWSNFARQSRYDAATGKYIDWGKNRTARASFAGKPTRKNRTKAQ